MQQRIRAAIASDQAELLAGVIEADEMWLGGNPRKKNKCGHESSKLTGKGGSSGTDRTPIVGAAERDDNEVA
ncbi:MAG: transposase [Gemmatimonadetes bacterium]|nr:transposase [Gemmatimonadota bacterium]